MTYMYNNRNTYLWDNGQTPDGTCVLIVKQAEADQPEYVH